MKAVLVDESSRQLYVGDWEDPVMGKEDIMVSVKTTALNRADLVQKIGKYPPPPGESTVLGLEMAGVVEAVGGSVTQWSIGDRVCALLPGGGYAEKVKLPASLALPIPEGFSFEMAAAIPEVFLTAYLNLFDLGRLQAGQTFLVHAAAGGVGPAAIPLAKVAGARVIATVRTDDKKAACLEFGADAAVNTTTEDFAALANEITREQGVNLILDPVGASYFEQNLKCLSTEGKLVIIGLMGGYKLPDLDLRKLLMRRWQFIGSTLRALSVERKAGIIQEFSRRFLPLFTEGRLKPTIDSVYDVAQINEAHARMEKNLNVGKIIVRLNF